MRRKRMLRRRIPIALGIIVVVLVAIRLALPFALKTYINHTLDGITGYAGHVNDVDVALWRGAYKIQGVDLVKTRGKIRDPFISADEIDIGIDWRAILQGRLKTRIRMRKPEMNFVFRKEGETTPKKVDESWQQQLRALYPFDLNRFQIVDGIIRYKDETKNPKIIVDASRLNLNAENISNTERSPDRLPSSVALDGTLFHSGKLHASAKFNMFEEPIELDMNAALQGLDLKQMNAFAKVYGGFDFEKGKMDAAMELAASKTRFNGYLKTVAQDVDVLDFSKELKKGDSVGHLLWEGLAGTILDIFKNQKKDRFAARVPISGSRKDLKINSWATIGSILKNAFIKAYTPSLEDSVNFNDTSRSAATESAQDDKKSKSK